MLRALARTRGATTADDGSTLTTTASTTVTTTAARRRPRFARALLLWVDVDSIAALDRRLDGRVCAMAARGLLAEVAAMAAALRDARAKTSEVLKLAPSQTPSPSPSAARAGWDFTRGLLQAIGCKELLEAATLMPRAAPEAELLAAVQTRTRRYARQQRAWLQNRWVRAAHPLPYPLFRFSFDGGDGATSAAPSFAAAVVAPAVALSVAFVRATGRDDEAGWAAAGAPYRVATGAGPANTDWERHVCERCGGRLFLGSVQWRAHLRSRGHRNARGPAGAGPDS